MLNQVVLVGRLTKNIEIEEEENNKIAILNLAIPRSYKNAEGIYETDFVECIASGNIATNTAEYCKKGDIVGVKGRIETKPIIVGITEKYEMQIIAEKITFLSSRKEEE